MHAPTFSVLQPVRGGRGQGETLGQLVVPARELAAVYAAARRARAAEQGRTAVHVPRSRLLRRLDYLPYLEGGDRVRPSKDVVVLRDAPTDAGEMVSVQAELVGRHVSLIGASESETFRSSYPFPLPEFDLLVAATSPANRVAEVLAWCARTHPFSLARALDAFPEGEYPLLRPLRHTFPDGLPPELFQPMLESEVVPLREAAIKALRGARPTAGRSR